jgi:hypothetical protein
MSNAVVIAGITPNQFIVSPVLALLFVIPEGNRTRSFVCHSRRESASLFVIPEGNLFSLFVTPEGNLLFLFVIPEGNLLFFFVIPEGNLLFLR